MPKNSGFKTSNVRWKYPTSPVSGGTRRDVPESFDVTCGDCGEMFRPTESNSPLPGRFLRMSGNTIVTCPKCGQQGSAPFDQG